MLISCLYTDMYMSVHMLHLHMYFIMYIQYTVYLFTNSFVFPQQDGGDGAHVAEKQQRQDALQGAFWKSSFLDSVCDK